MKKVIILSLTVTFLFSAYCSAAERLDSGVGSQSEAYQAMQRLKSKVKAMNSETRIKPWFGVFGMCVCRRSPNNTNYHPIIYMSAFDHRPEPAPVVRRSARDIIEDKALVNEAIRVLRGVVKSAVIDIADKCGGCNASPMIQSVR
jgi:hypothetical protein